MHEPVGLLSASIAQNRCSFLIPRTQLLPLENSVKYVYGIGNCLPKKDPRRSGNKNGESIRGMQMTIRESVPAWDVERWGTDAQRSVKRELERRNRKRKKRPL